jgi:hypothetical protein
MRIGNDRSLDHPADDRELLGVLLAEVGGRRAARVEQLGHDGDHAAEVAGADRPLQPVGQGSGVDRHAGRAVRVHRGGVGGEHQVDALGLRQREVPVEVAGIRLEVLPRPELQRVHEQRHGHDVLIRPGPPHQREVALVEEPHRGNEPDGPACRARLVARREELAGRRDHVHRASTSSISRARPSSSRPDATASPAAARDSAA